MTVYAESSAVLAWLLGEKSGGQVKAALSSAEVVVTSDLTIIECNRALIRCVTTRALSEADASERLGHLSAVSTTWHILRVHPNVAERARQPFPAEPIRTLDALHLASALSIRAAFPGLSVLALDQRIRRNARELGFSLVPR